jgi:hypothetical protein
MFPVLPILETQMTMFMFELAVWQSALLALIEPFFMSM